MSLVAPREGEGRRTEWRSGAKRELHGGRDKIGQREEAEKFPSAPVCAYRKYVQFHRVPFERNSEMPAQYTTLDGRTEVLWKPK